MNWIPLGGAAVCAGAMAWGFKYGVMPGRYPAYRDEQPVTYWAQMVLWGVLCAFCLFVFVLLLLDPPPG